MKKEKEQETKRRNKERSKKMIAEVPYENPCTTCINLWFSGWIHSRCHHKVFPGLLFIIPITFIFSSRWPTSIGDLSLTCCIQVARFLANGQNTRLSRSQKPSCKLLCKSNFPSLPLTRKLWHYNHHAASTLTLCNPMHHLSRESILYAVHTL